MNIAQLETMNLPDLRGISRDLEIQGAARLKKEDLILRIMQADAERRGLELRGGILEIMGEGMGFLRADHYLPGPNDIYVSQSQIRRFSLRTGDMVIGQIRPPKDTEKYFGLLRVEPINSHVRVAEMALERAKRLVEVGRDVVILMDSLTRLARAYNLMVTPSGRTLSGGLDPAALYPPKRFFGAARNFEDGASLTIIATCLVDTGSRMDDVVYEEFKGTGNMELHLSRRLQERRIFPAFDIERSSTRREELLLGPDITPIVWLMRRMFSHMITPPPSGAGMDITNATEAILQRMARTDTNLEFLETLQADSN